MMRLNFSLIKAFLSRSRTREKIASLLLQLSSSSSSSPSLMRGCDNDWPTIASDNVLTKYTVPAHVCDSLHGCMFHLVKIAVAVFTHAAPGAASVLISLHGRLSACRFTARARRIARMRHHLRHRYCRMLFQCRRPPELRPCRDSSPQVQTAPKL